MLIKIAGYNYFYKDSGAGKETILLLHGNPDSSDVWDDLIPLLSPNYRCIAPDLAGFGRSEIDRQVAFTLESASAWVQTFIQALEIEGPVHLFVHDVGAFYGLAWAVEFPDQVRSICVLNTLFFSDYQWHFWGRVWRTPILGELAMLFSPKSIFKRELKRGSPSLSDDFLEKTYAHISPKMNRTVLNMYRSMHPSVFKGWEDRYVALTQQKPIIVVWGDRDPYISLKYQYAERMAQGQQVHHIANCGHWVAVEEPELLAKYWHSFIQQQLSTD